MVGIKVSPCSEYKVKSGLSCIEQFTNLGQNDTCCYVVLDEWKYICMYTVYVVVLNQNTPVVGKTLFWGLGWRGDNNKFSVHFMWETENFESSLPGTDVFYSICFQFQEPPPAPVVINDTCLSANDSETKYSNSIHQ